jgi:hypothetical protein
MVLEVSSVLASILARYGVQLHAVAAWCSKEDRRRSWKKKTKKQWSEKIAQYSMMSRYVDVQDAACMESLQRWLGRLTTGNSGFAERIRLCRGHFVGPSAELICAECRRRHRLTHGTTVFADGRTVGTTRPSASRFLCRGLALGT